MKRVLYLLIFVLVVGVIVWLVPTDAPVPSEPIDVPAEQTSTPVPEAPSEPAVVEPVDEEAAGIRGRVLLLETGDGVGGTTVRVSWVEDEERRDVEAVTDAEGRFAVTSRGDGDYRIEV